MARKQVLVQLDDDLVERLDTYATAHETNRSAVLRAAAETLLDAEERTADAAEADRLLVESYRRLPQDPAWVAWADAAQEDAFRGSVNEWADLDPQHGRDGC